MGYTTKISDSEMERAVTHVPECEGYDVEAVPAKSEKLEAPVTTSKVVEAEEKAPAKKSTARAKAK